MIQDARLGSVLDYETAGWEGDLMHLKNLNCISGRWLLVVGCQDFLLSKNVFPWTCRCCCFVSIGFTVLLLAGRVHHQPSSQREKFMILVLMNLLTLFLHFILEDLRPRPAMNTFFPVKSWELFFIMSTDSFSVLHY